MNIARFKMKLTVNEYATRFKTSVQSVYQRIKRGSLNSVEENGIKYVIVEDETVKPSLNAELESEFKDVFKIVERLQEENKALRKENKRLMKKLEKAKDDRADTLIQFIGEMKRLSAPVNDEIIDVKIKPKKKKTKRGKNND